MSKAIFITMLVALLLVGRSFLLVSVHAKKVHIPDDLDDVVDNEEDEEWKAWGKPKPKPSPPFEPPPDFSNLDPSKIQEEMLKRHMGTAMGFVKLRLGVPRTKVILTFLLFLPFLYMHCRLLPRAQLNEIENHILYLVNASNLNLHSIQSQRRSLSSIYATHDFLMLCEI